MKLLLDKIIEIEVSQIVGATKGEHSKERKTHLSGTRPRQFDTCLGAIDLKIPKVLNGGYVHFFVNAKQRYTSSNASSTRSLGKKDLYEELLQFL